MPYRTLDPEKIIATAASLERRIEERFPGAGLANVAQELVRLARDTSVEAEKLTRPYWWLRILIALVIAGGALSFIFIGSISGRRRSSAISSFFVTVSIDRRKESKVSRSLIGSQIAMAASGARVRTARVVAAICR